MCSWAPSSIADCAGGCKSIGQPVARLPVEVHGWLTDRTGMYPAARIFNSSSKGSHSSALQAAPGINCGAALLDVLLVAWSLRCAVFSSGDNSGVVIWSAVDPVHFPTPRNALRRARLLVTFYFRFHFLFSVPSSLCQERGRPLFILPSLERALCP